MLPIQVAFQGMTLSYMIQSKEQVTGESVALLSSRLYSCFEPLIKILQEPNFQENYKFMWLIKHIFLKREWNCNLNILGYQEDNGRKE